MHTVVHLLHLHFRWHGVLISHQGFAFYASLCRCSRGRYYAVVFDLTSFGRVQRVSVSLELSEGVTVLSFVGPPNSASRLEEVRVTRLLGLSFPRDMLDNFSVTLGKDGERKLRIVYEILEAEDMLI